MAVSKEEMIDALSNMSVLEVSELVKELEEKWGVSAAAPVAAVAAAPGAAGEAAAEDHTLAKVASVYLRDNNAVHDGLAREGAPFISMAPVLKHGIFPLPSPSLKGNCSILRRRYVWGSICCCRQNCEISLMMFSREAMDFNSLFCLSSSCLVFDSSL